MMFEKIRTVVELAVVAVFLVIINVVMFIEA